MIYGVRFECLAYHNELGEIIPVKNDPAWLYGPTYSMWFARESAGPNLAKNVSVFTDKAEAEYQAKRLLDSMPVGLLLTGAFKVMPLVEQFEPKFVGYKPAD